MLFRYVAMHVSISRHHAELLRKLAAGSQIGVLLPAADGKNETIAILIPRTELNLDKPLHILHRRPRALRGLSCSPLSRVEQVYIKNDDSVVVLFERLLAALGLDERKVAEAVTPAPWMLENESLFPKVRHATSLHKAYAA